MKYILINSYGVRTTHGVKSIRLDEIISTTYAERLLGVKGFYTKEDLLSWIEFTFNKIIDPKSISFDMEVADIVKKGDWFIFKTMLGKD